MAEATQSCLLCGAPHERQSVRAPEVYGGEPRQAFWRCAECDAIYLYPPTSEQDDLSFYESEFDKWMVKRSGDEAWLEPATQYPKWAARELPLRGPWLREHVRRGDRVLEIGSSSGFTLVFLRDEVGAEPVGVEVSPEYARFANEEKGVRTYLSTEELDAAGEEPFDLVLHYYVLEHVSEPLGFLRDCLRYVGPGGKMIFEVPNAMDPLITLYEVPEFEEFYWWRAHHWYFTPKSLGYVLGKLGRPYEIHPGQRYDLSNHVVWMAEGKPGGMGRYDHVLSEQTKRSYAEDLKRSGHCDHMIAIVS